MGDLLEVAGRRVAGGGSFRLFGGEIAVVGDAMAEGLDARVEVRYAERRGPHVDATAPLALLSISDSAIKAGESATIAKNLENDRTSVSGVNLDEEAAKLLQYQQAYQAAGKLMQTADSLRMNALPIGLAHNMVLKRDIAAGEVVTWNDVDYDATKQAVAVRREQEALFRKEMQG